MVAVTAPLWCIMMFDCIKELVQPVILTIMNTHGRGFLVDLHRLQPPAKLQQWMYVGIIEKALYFYAVFLQLFYRDAEARGTAYVKQQPHAPAPLCTDNNESCPDRKSTRLNSSH